MYITQLIKSLKPKRREHWLMLSILIYLLTGVLSYYLPNTICNSLTAISGFTFICIIIFNLRGIPLRGLTRLTYIFLILWSMIITIKMFFFDDVKATFTEYHGISTWILAYLASPYLLPNLMPFILLIFQKGYNFDFNYLWKIMKLLCILYLCYYPFAFWNMTHFSWSAESIIGTEWGDAGTYGDFIQHSTIGISSFAPVVIMIYFKKYLPFKQWRWFLIAYLGSIIITIFLARRGGLVMSLMYLVFAWLMYSIFDKKTSIAKMILIATIAITLGYILFSGTTDTLFATMIDRGTEDTRSSVEDSFYADMKTMSDWIFGRGWFGQYYEPVFGTYRSSIETGYLTLILRGGLLYLVPYVLILALTFLNGIFRSKNLFCKSFATICIMQLISLYPFGWPEFNFFHFIIWIGVWVCNSKRIRKMTDEQISLSYFDHTLKR